MNERFEVETKSSESNIRVRFRETTNLTPQTPFLEVILLAYLNGSGYSIECFEVTNGSKDEEGRSRLHSIKVEGNWNLKTLEEDLLKMVKKEFTTFRRQYYPF